MKLMTPEGKFRFYPVGPVDRLQKTVDCPHGKINSEHEAEQKQRSVFDFRYMREVRVGQLDDIHWNQPLEAFHREVGQIQKADDGADEYQKRKQGKNQIVGQSGGGTPYVVAEIPLDQALYSGGPFSVSDEMKMIAFQ